MYEIDYLSIHDLSIKFWCKLDLCEWHFKYYVCIWWICMFHKVYPFKWKVLDLVKEVFNLKVELLHDVLLAKAKSNHMFEKVTCTCNFEVFQFMIFWGQFWQFLIKKFEIFWTNLFLQVWIQKDLSNTYVKKLNYKSMMSILLFHHFIDPGHLFKMSNT